ncbi:LPXTG cell wall anchor domain-containing protein [Candidatus Saccharibacteria bacterium]|nr:LPXTG cell wall anchor domain-containing protein [Candidatus Saccharibacteria bacterium]
MKTNQQLDSKKLLVLVLLGVATTLLALELTALPARAQEINPDPGTYSYGSTSEFSPYVSLSASGNSSLAQTGSDQLVGYLAAGLLALGASVALYLSRKPGVRAAKNVKT